MTNFSGENLNAACGGPQGGGMDSRRNGVAEVSSTYLAEMASNSIPVGYKQTEVGVIPEDWEVVTLGDIGQTVIGLTYSPNDVADFGTLVLRSSNVQNGKLAYADNVYVNMGLPERVIVKQGDILICVRNGSRQLIGKCALIDENAEGSAFGAFMSIFRTKYSVFVFYQFQSDLIQNQINEIMGATINQITNKDMSGFKIALPSDEKEQTAIANALSDVDALISELEKLIAKKQAIKTATMQQLLTGRTRLPAFAHHPDGSPKGYKSSELGEIPEDWEVIELGSITSFLKGAGLPKSDLVDNGKKPCIHYGQLFTTYGPIINQPISATNAYAVITSIKNDVLMPTSDVTPNGLATASCIQKSGVILGGDILIIRADSKQLNGIFFAYLVKIKRDQIMQLVTGSTVYHLYGSDMAKLLFAKPSLKEQTAIATILSDMDAEIEALEQHLSKTRQIKQGMMQELLTGKTRLPIT